jgi:hypothetical protein
MRIFPYLPLQLLKADDAGGGGEADQTMSQVLGRLGLSALAPAESADQAKDKPKAKAAAAEAPDPERDLDEEGAGDEGNEPNGGEVDPADEPADEPEGGAEDNPAEESEEDDEGAEDQAAELRAEMEQHKTRVAELEAQLKKAQTQPVAIGNVHPLLWEDDLGKISAVETQLEEFERWALQNWDGVEAQDAEGDKPATPGYTKEQVRDRYHQVKKLREQLIPQARVAAADRKQARESAKVVYPELFNPSRTEYKTAEALLARAPGLAAIFPNVHLVIGDALAGEKLRLERAKAKAKKAPAKLAPGQRKGAPAKPSGGAAGAGRVGQSKAKGVNAEQFMAAGATKDALVSMLTGMTLPVLRESAPGRGE